MEEKKNNPDLNALSLPPIKEAAVSQEASCPVSPSKRRRKFSMKGRQESANFIISNEEEIKS